MAIEYKALKPRVKAIEIEGYGTHYIRILSLKESDEINAIEVKTDNEAYVAVVIRCLSDEHGNRAISDNEIEVVMGLPLDLLTRVFKEAIAFSLCNSEEDASKKNNSQNP